MDSESEREALALFEKYRDALTGEFLTFEKAQDAETAAKIFLNKLDGLGFAIASHMTRAASYERADNGEAITVITFSFNLSLVPKGVPFTDSDIAANRIAAGEAVARVYSLPTTPPPREGEWNFTEQERHAFLCALERHKEKLITACAGRGIHESADDWRIIFSGVGAMTIGPNDAFVFGCLLEAEIPFLETRNGSEELSGCPCKVNEHIAALEKWRERNIQRRRHRV